MQLLFDMFSTLMSIELKLKVKTVNILMYGCNAGPPVAIPIYTVLLYCVIILTALGVHVPYGLNLSRGLYFRCLCRVFLICEI